jgi:hypothetical protein
MDMHTWLGLFGATASIIVAIDKRELGWWIAAIWAFAYAALRP